MVQLIAELDNPGLWGTAVGPHCGASAAEEVGIVRVEVCGLKMAAHPWGERAARQWPATTSS